MAPATHSYDKGNQQQQQQRKKDMKMCLNFFFLLLTVNSRSHYISNKSKVDETGHREGERERESERQKCFMILNIWRCSFHFHLVCPLLCAPCISANSSPNSYNFPSIFSIKHCMTYTLHIALRFDSKCCSILRYPICWQQIKVIIFFFNV